MKRLVSLFIACVCLFGTLGTLSPSTVLAESGGPSGPSGQFTIGWDPMDLPGMQADYALDTFGAINSPERAAEVAPLISRLNDHGISYMAYYGFDHVEGDDAYANFPALNTDVDGDGIIDGVAVSLEGNYNENYGMPGYYAHTVGSPVFRNYLISAAEFCIDAGATAVCYDVAGFGTNSFDPGSVASFADYLDGAGYTASELGLPEGTDIATFSYRTWLLDQGYTDAGMTAAASGWWTNPDNPDYAIRGLDDVTLTDLWRIWVPWHDSFLKQFVTELSNTTKTYAMTEYGRDFYLTFNRYGNGGRWLVSEIADFECGETFINDASYHYPHQSMAPVYKANLTADQTRFWSWNWPVIRDGSNALTDIASLYSAETLASGGLLQFTLSPNEADLREILKPYSLLARQYPELLSLTPEATTAIFYGQEANLGNESSFKGTACLVADSHADYNVVFGGDGTIRQDTMATGDLDAYDTVILPNVWSLTENQIAVLLDYANNGGLVIVTGGTDTGDNTDWQNLLNIGGGTWGAGEVVKITGDPGYEYWHATDAEQRSTMLAAWQAATTGLLNQLTTTLPSDVNIYSYHDAADDSDIYHLVNSLYDESTGEVTAQSSETITLPYPEGRTGDVTVSLIRPGDSAPTVLGTFASTDTIQVTIDTLDIWGIIKVGSAIPAAVAIDDKPFSEAKPVFDYDYWTLTEGNIAIDYEAVDDISLDQVTLYFRYRADSADSWGTWTTGLTADLTGEAVSGVSDTFYFNPKTAGEGGDGMGEGHYQFYTLAVDGTAQSEPDKGYAETERGYDITPPPDVLYTETHGVISGTGTQITDPSFTWVAQEDALSGLAMGEDYTWQVSWGITGNPQNHLTSEAAFTPDSIWPNGPSTEYRLQVRLSDMAGNWNGGDAGAFIYRIELPGAPFVLSYEADQVLKDSARLNAYLGSPGEAEEVQVSFVWGTEPGNYTQETAPQTLNASDSIIAVISGLTPGTTYYFRSKAAGVGTYTVFSGEQNFTTAGTEKHQLMITTQTGGTVTAPGEGGFLYDADTSVNLLAVPQQGYNFETWAGDTSAIDDITNPETTILMDADYSIWASFTEEPVTPPDTPTNQSPPDGYVYTVPEVTLQGSAFSDNEGTHNASQWQIIDDQQSIVWDSGETVTALTSCTVPPDVLEQGTTYTWKVTYKNSFGVWSPWSDATSFTTFTPQPGDLNQDGYIDVLDITGTIRIILMMDQLNLDADANEDGQVNILDITIMIKKILHID